MEQIEHELAEILAQRDRLQAQLEKLRCEEASLRKRNEIALRVLRRGHNPKTVLELSEEGLVELETRLVKLEQEEQLRRNGPHWFISQLLRNPAQQKERQLPLSLDGLAKDPLRVKKLRIASLKNECDELMNQLGRIKDQVQIVMGYDHSEDQIARLDGSKTRIEKELRQKQVELTCLTGQTEHHHEDYV